MRGREVSGERGLMLRGMLQGLGSRARSGTGRGVLSMQRARPSVPPSDLPGEAMPPASSFHREGPAGPVLLGGEAWSSSTPRS